MSILKYTTKYFLRGGLALIVIIGISGLVFSQRQKKETEPVVPSDSPTQTHVRHTPRATQPSPGGHRVTQDGTWHADTPPPARRNDGSVPKRTVRTKTSSRSTKAANQNSLGWITWKYGSASGAHDHHYSNRKRLPEEIRYEVHLLAKVQSSRESLHNWFEEIKRDIAKMDPGMVDLDVMLERQLEMHEFYLPEARKLLLDKKGIPLPPMTDEEFKEEELRRLVGDRNLEEATQFLEKHEHYNELLLSRLDDERAFEYLHTIESPVRMFGQDHTALARVYAERVLATDSDNLKARVYLADTAPRSSAADYESALVQYESILSDHPDSPHALVEAADVLVFLEKPLKAVEYLKRGHELGARQGFFETGIAYQQLGDYKTAWVYMNKASQLPFGYTTVNWSPRGQMRAIKEGNPVIKPLPIEKLDFTETGALPLVPVPDPVFGSTLQPEGFVPSDTRFSDDEAAYQRAEAETARREEIQMMRQMSEQEIDEFIQWAQWAKQLMRDDEAAAHTTDFLAKEMAAHLTSAPAQFSPQRIVRANELIKRHGYEEGLSRIIKDDPEIAIQIQLLRNQEPIPRIKNKKKE